MLRKSHILLGEIHIFSQMPSGVRTFGYMKMTDISSFEIKNWKKKNPIRRGSKTDGWMKRANIKSRKKKEGNAKGIYLKAFLQVWLRGPTRLIERKVALKT